MDFNHNDNGNEGESQHPWGPNGNPLIQMVLQQALSHIANETIDKLHTIVDKVPGLHIADLVEATAGKLVCESMKKSHEYGITTKEGAQLKEMDAVREQLTLAYMAQQEMIDSVWKMLNGEKGSVKITLEMRE